MNSRKEKNIKSDFIPINPEKAALNKSKIHSLNATPLNKISRFQLSITLVGS